MRIVLVNWARIKDGASHGGGVNGYCQSIAAELSSRGHEVISLCSGVSYEPSRNGRDIGPCSIAAREPWRGVTVYEVVNSPVLAPSLAQFRDPGGEVSSPKLEREVRRLFAELRPDIVHFHNIEGFSCGCVSEAKRAGARTFFSLHNYHTICPQVYLMQGHRRACFDFDDGRACEKCIPTVDPREERLRLAGILPRTPPPDFPSSSSPRQAPSPWTTPEIPAYRPLLNIIEPSPSTTAAGPYARRRHAMIEMLNSCDRSLAVSDFVRGKFESMGARGIRMIRIGSRMQEVVSHSPTCPPPPMSRDRAIRIAFMGYNNWYKGLPMLADSLGLLTPEILGRFHLSVFALHGEQMEPEFRKLEPQLAGLRLVHGYQYEDVPALLAGIDLGLVTSVWWDNAPQTVMEFQACGLPILGAALGGIPEFVIDGVNGRTFRGNDRWDLARTMAEVARDPLQIERWRSNVRPPKSVAEHVRELEAEYLDRLESRPRGA